MLAIAQKGFIPFVQTNVPQSLLSYSCGNPVYGMCKSSEEKSRISLPHECPSGTTNTPEDIARTSGGSSGGEAALLAADGSVIGIGGDVGGSIRIPCHFTGTAGIKPSHLRFSHRGVPGAVPGRPLINANEGPMTKDIQTSVDFLKEVWSNNWITEHDPYVPPVLWNDEMYRKGAKYRIGYYVDDSWFTPAPAIQDIIDPSLYGQMLVFVAPIWLQRLLAYPVEYIFPRVANMMRAMTLSTSELRETYAAIEQYRGDFTKRMLDNDLDALLCPPQVLITPKHDIPGKLFSAVSYTALFNLLDFGAELRETYAAIEQYRGDFTKLMLDNDLDALLCPPQVLITPKHDIPGKLFSAVSYTALFNLLDFGAGVVNVTKVKAEDEQRLLSDYPQTDVWYRKAKEACKGSEGFPVNVQVAAPPYREEIVLRLLKDIETAVTGK
ncbi:Amidase [Ancylostoma caninum]|uniref:Amidase n=1 Tax=Ancylostoma caninum TaxID=29170 RepID=A0A368G1F4_ANCCA|nr:Amidase [Ancylostoma caninum]